MSPKGPIASEGRIRRAAVLMLLALAVEASSMYWRHPLSFYYFIAAGGLLAVLGTLSFLHSMVSSSEARPDSWASVVDTLEESRQAAGGDSA
jgi:hypothetical protein